MLNSSPSNCLSINQLVSLSINFLLLPIHFYLLYYHIRINSILRHVRVILNVELTVNWIVRWLNLFSLWNLVAYDSLFLLACSSLDLLALWSSWLLIFCWNTGRTHFSSDPASYIGASVVFLKPVQIAALISCCSTLGTNYSGLGGRIRTVLFVDSDWFLYLRLLFLLNSLLERRHIFSHLLLAIVKNLLILRACVNSSILWCSLRYT